MNFSNWFKDKTITKKGRYGKEDSTEVMQVINFTAIITQLVSVVIALSFLFGSVYTVEEGHVGIVKRFSEAQEQVDPGLHFKFPFIDSIEEIEIRTRKNVEALAAATSEQMPVQAQVSVNWTVDKTQALEMFKKYGGLSQFENRILDPKLRAASKTAISKYTAEQLIKERASATSDIELLLVEQMSRFNISLDSVQIENVGLPAKYLQSIETKQNAKNLADAEQFNLEKQALEAQRGVNTAQAKADGIDLISIAKAAATEREGLAEAAAIKAKGAALINNPLIVQLTHEQQWNGSLLTTSFGGNTGVLVQADELIK